MSNIYIQEPPSHGKVLLTTTLGDIDIELWSKEAPKACRNFVQLCMEGYYNNTIFHRVEKGFIAQGGDPTGTGTGGESIYGKPFKDEFHQRLKFNRRGLVAMANAGPDDNGSQFFFTLDRAIELDKKHTIFGKVTGDTIYNMIRFNDLDVDEDNRPFCPPKVIKSQVLCDPFDDIEPRTTNHLHNDKEEKKKEKVKSKSKATKNYKLLSFGEEAEEDEEETDQMIKDIQIKSSHDVLHDPKLSSVPAVDASGKETTTEDSKPSTQKRAKIPDINETDESDGDESGGDLEKPRKKKTRKSKNDKKRQKISGDKSPVKDEERKIPEIKEDLLEGDNSDEDDEKSTRKKKKKKKPSDIGNRLQQISQGETPVKSDNMEKGGKDIKNDMLIHLAKERNQFLKKKKNETILKKGQSRQEETLALLASFESKVASIVPKGPEEGVDVTDLKGDSWMTHNLKFVEPKDDAKDANMKGDDWYDIYDPRNPANQRRREESGKDVKQTTK